MNFLEIEKIDAPNGFHMNEPHSHDYYELYFLFEGNRQFFIDNKMFIVSENTFVVVPPYSMHKTEGGPYVRINVNISPSLLTDSQNELLMKTSEKIAIQLNNKYVDIIKRLLFEGANVQAMNMKNKNEYLLALIKTVMLFLSLHENVSLSAASTAYSITDVTPEVLKIIYYINTHYSQTITLKILCDEFFMSKVSLCKKFKEVMHCSIMEYVLRLRLNKAKSLLRETKKSIEEIAALCGFSSANYFGLIFKKEVGLSPLNYKKTR